MPMNLHPVDGLTARAADLLQLSDLILRQCVLDADEHRQVNFLDLALESHDFVRLFEHARGAAIQPLAEQAQAQQQAIAQSLAGGNPDPQAIGQAFIALNGLQKQIAAANAQSVTQFEQLLTPDQLQRLNGIRAGAQVCPIVPALQATGLLAPMP